MRSLDPFIHKKVIVLSEDSTIEQAARAMCDNNVGCVVISGRSGPDAGRIIGMATDRDLVCNYLAFAPGEIDLDIPLSEVMTPGPVLATANQSLDDVIKLMRENGIRRVPVVDHFEGRQHCVGIITLDDLIAAEAFDTDELAQIVRAQIRRRGEAMRRLRNWKTRERAEVHKEESLNRFQKILAEKMGMEKEDAYRLCSTVLGLLVQRVHYTGAVHFVSQLPQILKDELLDLPAGPNRSITLEYILQRLVQSFSVDAEKAVNILQKFFSALESMVDRGDLDHLKAQLPKDLQALISEGAAESQSTSAA